MTCIHSIISPARAHAACGPCSSMACASAQDWLIVGLKLPQSVRNAQINMNDALEGLYNYLVHAGMPTRSHSV